MAVVLGVSVSLLWQENVSIGIGIYIRSTCPHGAYRLMFCSSSPRCLKGSGSKSNFTQFRLFLPIKDAKTTERLGNPHDNTATCHTHEVRLMEKPSE